MIWDNTSIKLLTEFHLQINHMITYLRQCLEVGNILGNMMSSKMEIFIVLMFYETIWDFGNFSCKIYHVYFGNYILHISFVEHMHVYNKIWPALLLISLSNSSHSPGTNSFQLCLFINHQVQLVLPICAWVWDHPLEHGNPTSVYILKK